MKKSKLSVSLVTTFIASLAMTSCGKVTSNEKAVVTFKGYDGQEVDVLTDSVYQDYLKTSAGIGKIYDAMLEVLVRYEFQNENSKLKEVSQTGETTKRSYAQIQQDAKNEIAGLKKEAKNKGGTYSEEWEKVLDNYGVENEKELLQKLIYQSEEEEIKDWYFRVNKEALLKEYIGLTQTDKANSKFPYHVRHILTSISGGESNFYNGTITSQEALSLYTVVKALYDGKSTFGEIAHDLSGDSGSAEKYGSVGIMDTSTSFVNEFKLGIYAYDALYSGADLTTLEAADLDKGLGLTGKFLDTDTAGEGLAYETTVADKLDEIGLGYVPYNAFVKLNEYREDTTDDNGKEVNEGNEHYYPRNIYWNKYLNRHNVFVITNNVLPTSSYNGTINGNVDEDINVLSADSTKTGFRSVTGITTGSQAILTDEQGRPIIGVRSQHGIHFMILEKSMTDTGLQAYYNPDALIPGDEGYDASVKTYVTYENTTNKSVYKDRAEELKNTIKNFDSTYSYRLFEYFVAAEGTNISFLSNDSIDLEALVKSYIASQREYNMWNAAESMNSSWRSYLELITIQEANRTEERLIPEMCALKFKDASTDTAFAKGGACYYAK